MVHLVWTQQCEEPRNMLCIIGALDLILECVIHIIVIDYHCFLVMDLDECSPFYVWSSIIWIGEFLWDESVVLTSSIRRGRRLCLWSWREGSCIRRGWPSRQGKNTLHILYVRGVYN